jgi:FkbM family methyltransferase
MELFVATFRRLLGGIKRRIWKPAFREAGMRRLVFQLAKEGEVHFAEWLHAVSAEPVITQEKVDFYKRFIRQGDLVIDIGAREGDTTVPMALAAGREGAVLAIDPNPHPFKVLVENARLNPGKTNIIPLNFAAARDDAEYTFGSGDPCFINGGIVGFSSNKACHSHYRFTIQGRNLARFLDENHASRLNRLAFIKVDVEGYDKEILKNLAGIISRYRPTVMAECFSELNEQERGELFHALADHNYRVFSLAEWGPWIGAPTSTGSETLRELAEQDMSVHRHFDLLGIPAEKV